MFGAWRLQGPAVKKTVTPALTGQGQGARGNKIDERGDSRSCSPLARQGHRRAAAGPKAWEGSRKAPDFIAGGGTVGTSTARPWEASSGGGRTGGTPAPC